MTTSVSVAVTTTSTSPSSSADQAVAPKVSPASLDLLAVIDTWLGPARVVCADRHGGVSHGAYASLNLALHVGDDADAVAENRRRAAQQFALPGPAAWCWLMQVHGTDVVDFDESVQTDVAFDDLPNADAAVTRLTARPLVVLAADCAPVVLACEDAVGIAHVGWRGLMNGIVERTVSTLRSIGRGPVRGLLGPCISAARYEFGADDLAKVVAQVGPGVARTTRAGHPALDLPAGVRHALRHAGVTEFVDTEVCTASSPDHYSYRRDGTTGRQATVVVLE